MQLLSWLRNRMPNYSAKLRGGRRPAPRFHPRLEALDDRIVPSQVNLTVNSLADSGPGTLRAAILTADAGSHVDKFAINFAVAGTVDLQSPLPDLNNSITVQGPGASNLIVERATGYLFNSSCVVVDAGATVSLSGLTIANGSQGGIQNVGTLTLSDCTISGNSNPNSNIGGGINNDGTMTVSNCIVSGNSAFEGNGGGIYNHGTMTVSNSTLSGNSVTLDFGGGIFNSGRMTVTNSTLSNNSAFEGDGGGICNEGGTVTVSKSTLSGNSALAGGGGGIANEGWGGGTVTVNGSTLSGNSALAGGGILNGAGTTVTVSDCTLSGNSALGLFVFFGEGGGIYNSSRLTVSNSTLSGNSAVQGGGIFNDFPGLGGALTVSNSTVSGNSAVQGGGIFNVGTATLQQSTLSGNTATEGAGIYNDFGGTLEVRGSTLSTNTAGDLGGGIFNLGTATLQQCTLSGNTAGSDGGGIFNAVSGKLTVKDSTVLNNAALFGADIYNLGALTLDDSTVGVIGP